MLTIRHESFGPLIFSEKLKKYLLVENPIYQKELLRILNTKQPENRDHINQEFLSELKAIGLEEGFRSIYSTNQDLMAPLEYYFDFTDRCNLRCSHCYNKDYLGQTTMPNEKIRSIIKDMYQNGIMRVHLAGGEPTLEPSGLETYMGTAKDYHIVSSMSTNGISIDQEILNIMFQNNLFSLTVSIESADEEKNAKIRGKGSLEKAKQTILKMVKEKEKTNSNTIICMKTSYDTTITKEDLEKVIQLGINLGVDVVKFANPERCLNHERGFYGNHYQAYYKTLEYVRELKEKYQHQIYISEVANPINHCGSIGLPNRKGCIGAQELLAINPGGRISPCLMNQISLGNIYNYDSIQEFWNNSKKLKQFRAAIASYDCKDCPHHEMCRGGCQVRKQVEYGYITGKDPLCPLKEYSLDQEKPKQRYRTMKEINVLHSL